ncbi:GmrSD restriction endonuclease domain-containing protein [Cryobacterium gelidum]|uniref:DUF262 domain-containing protein n=1 Tax=Cryobacterium gelidum TaxID=1259164 RepID=A0A4R9ARN1_9MICO|nr:DUF262 domain-containing protein [Cryobacterium gelidum]TFD68225.1 DUF262 domain-containing protein [Cryobacterium gelidum]
MLTQVTSPQQVFFSPQRLIVPLFQRPYVWSREVQWEPLWNDVTRLIDVIAEGDGQATHFLGAVVLQAQATALGDLPQYTVIDGQQRLTTLQILLDALHAQLESRGLAHLAAQVLTLVENPESFRQHPDDRFKVWPTNRDRPAFSAAMSAEAPIDHSSLPAGRLVDAHRYFFEAIGEWLDAEPSTVERRAGLLVPAITTRLQIVTIQLLSHEDAQEIFETLNARGTPLTAADLIKNYLFQRLEKDAAATESAYQDYWADFETPFWEAEVTTGRIKYARSSLFLTQWLTAKTLKEIPAREVFMQFKRYVGASGTDILTLLRALRSAADRYRAFTEGAAVRDGALSRLNLFVYRMSTLDSEITKPLLIWLGEPEQAALDELERARLLGTLESWFVRRALVRAQSQGTNRFMLDLLTQLAKRPATTAVDEAARTYLAVQTSSFGYWPDDAELRRELVDLQAYRKFRKGRLRMVLEAVEDQRRGFPGGRSFSVSPVSRGVCTIEHIMPQEWRSNWNDLTDVEAENRRDSIVQTLGNLTLVTQSLNARLSNAAWIASNGKRAALVRHDTLLLTRDVVHAESWSEAEILSRTDDLVEAISEIWSVPAGHRGISDEAVGRAQYRTEVVDLVRAGLLSPGSILYAKPAAHRGELATVNADGSLLLNGVMYATVSGAARHLQGGGAVAGWQFWCIDPGFQRTMADLRAEHAGGVDTSQTSPRK